MDVFEQTDYKAYLLGCLPTTGEKRGLRSRLAAALKCQSGYISQVLRGPGHFSLEHAAVIDEFLGHGVDESDAFLLLVHIARAGTPKLARTYQRQLERLRRRRRRVEASVGESARVNAADQARYYSSWHYAALHVLTMIARLRDPDALAAELGLPRTLVESSLRELAGWGLVEEDAAASRFTARAARWHLGNDSPWIGPHHTGWRLQAIRALERARDDEALHYSGPMAISARSVPAMRALLLEAIGRLEPLIAAPGEDVGRVVCIDFFRLGAE